MAQQIKPPPETAASHIGILILILPTAIQPSSFMIYSRKASEDAASTCMCVTHGRDQDGAFGSCLWPGLEQVVVALWGGTSKRMHLSFLSL